MNREIPVQTPTSTNDFSYWVKLGQQMTNEQKLSVYENGVHIPKDFSFPFSLMSGKNRSFQRSWMDKYPGLVYSIEEDGAYCMHCVLFENNPSNRGKLVKSPFRNWKKAIECFDEHFFGITPKSVKKGGSGYQRHLECVGKGDMFKQQLRNNTNVRILMDSALKERQDRNMQVLESIVKTVMLCGKQNIALRGHRDDSKYLNSENDSNTGNFQALLDFRIDSGDKILEQHFRSAPKNATYRSKTVQNELIDVIASIIREQIVKDIRDSGGMYSISADEVRDISNKEQLAVCLRFVDMKGMF